MRLWPEPALTPPPAFPEPAMTRQAVHRVSLRRYRGDAKTHGERVAGRPASGCRGWLGAQVAGRDHVESGRGQSVTGSALKQLRHSMGLTRGQVAAAVPGWNWSDVLQFERGQRQPAPWQLALILETLTADFVARCYRKAQWIRGSWPHEPAANRSQAHGPRAPHPLAAVDRVERCVTTPRPSQRPCTAC